MQRKRFNLPPLDLIQGFEAAARTLSFTKAAEELFITQSAVSRQIRGLEDHLGVALFERRPRSLVLTEQGRMLHRAATEFLERLQETTDRLRADGGAPHLTVTTTGGFASLWLIPRLRDVHGAASRRRCAHLRQLQDGQPGAQPGRRGGALLQGGGGAGRRHPPVRRGAVSGLQSGAADGGRPSPARARRPRAPRAAAHGRGQGPHGLGHMAGRAGPSPA